MPYLEAELLLGELPHRTRAQKLHRWRISHIRSTPAQQIGDVSAPDAEAAIRAAIEQFEITDPEQRYGKDLEAR